MSVSLIDIPGVREHLDATPLESPDAFVAKEHVWHIAEGIGVPQGSATRVFQGITFPVMPVYVEGRSHFAAINPLDYDLLIRSRKEVGMPYPPEGLFRKLRLHSSPYIYTVHQEKFGHLHDDVDNVVQTGSLLSFLENMGELSFRGLTAKGRANARLIGQELLARLSS